MGATGNTQRPTSAWTEPGVGRVHAVRLAGVVLAAACLAGRAGVTRAADAHTEPAAAAADGEKLYADEKWYQQQAGAEQVFRGKLQAVAAPRASSLMRNALYKLGNRTIYTGAKKLPAFDALAGKEVEIRGKAVDMELAGRPVREIWPAAIRPAPADPEQIKPAPPSGG